MCLWLFCLLWRLFSSYWISLSSLYMRIFAFSYCNFFFGVWLLSLGGLIFSERKQRVWSMDLEKMWWRQAGRSRSREKCGSDTLYEIIVYFQGKKSEGIKSQLTHWFLKIENNLYFIAIRSELDRKLHCTWNGLYKCLLFKITFIPLIYLTTMHSKQVYCQLFQRYVYIG